MTQDKPLLTPRFLTAEMAAIAVDNAVELVFNPRDFDGSSQMKMKNLLKPKRGQCHVVVMVPAMVDHRAEDYPDWPNYPVTPIVLYEESILAEKFKLDGPYDSIARCKALQLWTDRNDDRTDIVPHLLFPGDAPYWGGVKRRGLVVTCSGVQPYIDKLISGMVADMLVAMSHAAWENSEDCQNQIDFLT